MNMNSLESKIKNLNLWSSLIGKQPNIEYLITLYHQLILTLYSNHLDLTPLLLTIEQVEPEVEMQLSNY
jgi:hypothetical protein